MGRDWQAVATAIDARLQDLGMTQAELSHHAGVAVMTVRELQSNLVERRRSRRTLEAISTALGWPSDYLGKVAEGKAASAFPDESEDPILRSLDQIQAELVEVRRRLADIERRISDEADDA